MSTRPRGRVAVIGLGVSGVTAVKNLAEQGFDVVGYERNNHIGGLWHYHEDPSQTTVLKTTVANGSKSFSAYQDFPFGDDIPDYPTAGQIDDYIRDYARAFDIAKHFHLGTSIVKISKSDPTEQADPKEQDEHRWTITLKDEHSERNEVFERVLVTTGPFGTPYTPKVPGMNDFKGEIMHAQAYKGADAYAGKKVVVVGLANTGGDIAVDVTKTAEKVYISHRSGVRLLRRRDPPIDHMITRRRFYMGSFLNNHAPALASGLADRILQFRFRRENPEYQDEWGFFPAPPMISSPGVVNDQIVQYLSQGRIHNLFGIKRFTSSGIVTHTKDGKGEVKVDCDVVIFATACDFDYSILCGEADPTRHSTPEWDAIEGNNDLKYPKLYQTLFSVDHPESLAFIGPCRGFSPAAMSNSDLASQAIAQVWKGAHKLPSRHEMEKWCEDNYRRAINQAKGWRIPKTGAESASFEKWLNEAAGNRVNEMTGWGWSGWKFWWSDHKLYSLVMDGVSTPFVYRLFEAKEGGRKVYPGARAAIYKANGLTPPVDKLPGRGRHMCIAFVRRERTTVFGFGFRYR